MSILSQMVLRANLTRILTNPEMDGNLSLLAQTLDNLIAGTTQAGDAAELAGETKAELLALPSWIAPTLINGYTNYGNGYRAAGYLKDRNGRVKLRGAVTGGSGSMARPFTLPGGYVPTGSLIVPFAYFNGSLWTIGDISIASNGYIEPILTVSSNYIIMLDSIMFETT
jgi:hypothetical protein